MFINPSNMHTRSLNVFSILEIFNIEYIKQIVLISKNIKNNIEKNSIGFFFNLFLNLFILPPYIFIYYNLYLIFTQHIQNLILLFTLIL